MYCIKAPLFADEFGQLQQLRRQVIAAEKTLTEKQDKIDILKRTALILNRTAEVTTVPAVAAKRSSLQAVRLYTVSFDTPAGFKGYRDSKFAIADLPDGKALKIQSPPGAESVSRPFPVPPDCTIRITVQVQGENIVKTKPENYRGVRVGAIVQDGSQTLYPSAPSVDGTFAWRECFFETRIPGGVKSIWLNLGLSGATGTVYFRNLRINKIVRE